MNAILNAPAGGPTIELPSLSTRAMLVRVCISRWGGYAYDAHASQEVNQKAGVKAGRFNKKLMTDSKPFALVNEAWNSVYDYWTGRTVPWLDNGTRMLSNDAYLTFMPELRRLITTAERASDKLADAWESEVSADILRLGPLGRREDYPDDIRARYGASVRVLPVPEAGDFRVDIDERDRASLDLALAEVRRSVAEHLMKEISTPITKLATRISEYGASDRGRWHHSLVENVLSLAERLPALNIDRVPEIDDLAAELERTMAPYASNPDLLKHNPRDRDEAKDKLDAIMRKMSVFKLPQ